MRGFDEAVERAKLQRTDGKPVLHDCRHTFASFLIAQGLDIVFISRQLGLAGSELQRVPNPLDHAELDPSAADELVGGVWIVEPVE